MFAFHSRRAARWIVLAAVGTLAATGCSGTGTNSGGASGSSSGEPVEITYLHRLPDGDNMVKVADIVSRWNAENPLIQVNAVKYDGMSTEMSKKLETDVRAEKAPCLAQISYAETPEFYVKGLVEDVTGYAEQYRSQFSAAYQMMSVGGTVVGLPQDTGPLVYYYNEAEFDKLAVEVPTNLEEFRAVAAEAASNGKYTSAFFTDEAYNWITAQAAAAGGSWYTVKDDEWVVDVTGEGADTVSDLWQDLIDSDQTLVTERWGDTFPKALVDQKVIGTVGAAWEAPLLADSMAGTANEGEWAVAPLPDYGKGELTGPEGGSGVAVIKGCKYPEQAMEFNAWFNTQVSDLATQGLVPAALGTVETPELVRAFYGGQDVFAEFAKANDNLSTDFSFMPYFNAVGSSMNEAAAAAGGGGGAVMNIFEAAQAASIKALENGGLAVHN